MKTATIPSVRVEPEIREQIDFSRSSGRRSFSPFTCRKAGTRPFMRALIIPFGRNGYVALFEIEGEALVAVCAVRCQREDLALRLRREQLHVRVAEAAAVDHLATVDEHVV